MLKMAGPQVEQLCTMIEECNGLDRIEALQNHNNIEIYKLAYDIIEQYFSGDVSRYFNHFNGSNFLFVFGQKLSLDEKKRLMFKSSFNLIKIYNNNKIKRLLCATCSKNLLFKAF